MPDEREIDQYLLGRLSAAEREAFQAALLEDPELDALVQDRENDWLDALARGEARPEDAAAIRAYLAATGQEDRLRFAAALSRRRRRAVPWWIGAAAATVLLLAGSLFFLRREGQRAAAPPALIPVLLAGSATRGEQPAVARVSVPAGPAELDFEIAVTPEPEAAGYRLVLRGAAGRGSFERSGRPWPADGKLRVRAPAPEPGRYEVEVEAVDSSGAARPVAFHEIEVLPRR